MAQWQSEAKKNNAKRQVSTLQEEANPLSYQNLHQTLTSLLACTGCWTGLLFKNYQALPSFQDDVMSDAVAVHCGAVLSLAYGHCGPSSAPHPASTIRHRNIANTQRGISVSNMSHSSVPPGLIGLSPSLQRVSEVTGWYSSSNAR